MNKNPLNILHTIGLKALYPIIRCQLDVTGALDLNRLKRAIDLTAKIIPELFCRYDMANNSWIPVVTDAESLIQVVTDDAQLDSTPDWFTQPQLRVQIQPLTMKTKVIFTISHILTDGSGFKQFLYLLCSCYNYGEKTCKGENTVELDWLEALLREHPVSSKKVDHPTRPLLLPKIAGKGEQRPTVSGLRLSSTATTTLLAATHAKHVTVNDVLMAAFGKAVQVFNSDNDMISLACPTDMRQYISGTPVLRVANHTARYNLAIKSPIDEHFGVAVWNLHEQMETLKQDKQFLDSVQSLMSQYRKESIQALQKIVEENYHVREIGYTNFGIVDADRLKFDGVTVEHCLLTGSFRAAPMFQVACSTFNDELSLGFNMIGNADEVQFGQSVIQQMTNRIQEFSDEDELKTVEI